MNTLDQQTINIINQVFLDIAELAVAGKAAHLDESEIFGELYEDTGDLQPTSDPHH